jgi:hypothetical protein
MFQPTKLEMLPAGMLICPVEEPHLGFIPKEALKCSASTPERRPVQM